MSARPSSTAWADRLAWREILVSSRVLPRGFYLRPTVDVARDLLGKILVRGACCGRIVEVEAYLPEGDQAAHSARGHTPRTRVIFGPPGYAYVYLVYGMYECLNVVCEPAGVPGCVLIRALEPLCGLEAMRGRRPAAARRDHLCAGPGKLTRAMGITLRHYGADLTGKRLSVRQFEQEPAVAIRATPRIGIRLCADWPLRFVDAASPCLSVSSIHDASGQEGPASGTPRR